MALTTEQQILIEQRVANEARSTGLAYVLWFFFGSFGVHRIYLGSVSIGLCIPLLIWGGVALVVIANYPPGLFVAAVGCLVVLFDVFHMPALAAAERERLRAELTHRAMMRRPV